MTEEKRLKVLLDLQKSLREDMKYKVEIADVNGDKMLRCLAPLFEDDKGYVLIEICELDYDENFELFQIYSTLIMEPGQGLDELRKTVNVWNLTSTLGAYGIYEAMGQLFHKYNVVVGVDDDVDMVVGQVFAALYTAMNEMGSKLAEAINISNGKMSFADISK